MTVTEAPRTINGRPPSGFDWHAVHPDQITSREVAIMVMYELDGVVASIEQQLGESSGHARETGEFDDPAWFASAKAALKHVKRKRVLVQERLGAINRAAKVAQVRNFECAFVDAARVILAPEVFQSIVTAATALSARGNGAQS